MPIRLWRGKITYIINIKDIFHLTKTSHCKEYGERPTPTLPVEGGRITNSGAEKVKFPHLS